MNPVGTKKQDLRPCDLEHHEHDSGPWSNVPTKSKLGMRNKGESLNLKISQNIQHTWTIRRGRNRSCKPKRGANVHGSDWPTPSFHRSCSNGFVWTWSTPSSKGTVSITKKTIKSCIPIKKLDFLPFFLALDNIYHLSYAPIPARSVTLIP